MVKDASTFSNQRDIRILPGTLADCRWPYGFAVFDATKELEYKYLALHLKTIVVPMFERMGYALTHRRAEGKDYGRTTTEITSERLRLFRLRDIPRDGWKRVRWLEDQELFGTIQPGMLEPTTRCVGPWMRWRLSPR